MTLQENKKLILWPYIDLRIYNESTIRRKKNFMDVMTLPVFTFEE